MSRTDGPGARPSDDEVDELLVAAGARWRAEQPSAPEPDLERITARRRTAPRRWLVPALAAASVVVVATAALLVLPDRSEPAPSVAPGKEHPMQVRDGDKVQVQGQVVAAPGKPVLFCLPVATTLPLDTGPAKPPACVPGASVELSGVDVDRLPGVTVVQGVKTAQARLVGTWSAGRIAVEQQSAPSPPAPAQPAAGVPCPPPAGGWKDADASASITPAVERFVRDRSAQLQSPWIGWPEGFPADPTPGAPPDKPSVLVVGVAHGDTDLVRRMLEPLVAGNLCVTRVKLSQSEALQRQGRVNALPFEHLGITGSGLGPGDKPVLVTLRVLDEEALAALRPIGLDVMTIQPDIQPVG